MEQGIGGKFGGVCVLGKCVQVLSRTVNTASLVVTFPLELSLTFNIQISDEIVVRGCVVLPHKGLSENIENRIIL